MGLAQLTLEAFPTIYEQGKPIGVLLDLQTFQKLMAAAEQLERLDAADEPWIQALIERIRAYRQQHPEQTIIYDSIESALLALDMPDD